MRGGETAAEGGEVGATNPSDSPPKLTLGDRIVRYSELKSKQTRVARELSDLGHKETAILAARLAQCGTFLTFRDYYTVDQVKLVRACFCKKHTVCQLCAVRRSAKFLEQTLPKLHHLMEESFAPLFAHLVVFTVKNGPDLAERMRHLESAWKKLLKRKSNRRDYPNTFMRSVAGGIMSIEVTNRGKGWHPHCNVLVLSHRRTFDWQACKDEWLEITGDSHVVNFSTDTGNLEATLAETIKYVTKFSDLDAAQLWQLHQACRGRRLIRGFGKLWGLKVPHELTDDVLEGDLPYIEYVCRYLGRDGYTILTALESAAAGRAA